MVDYSTEAVDAKPAAHQPIEQTLPTEINPEQKASKRRDAATNEAVIQTVVLDASVDDLGARQIAHQRGDIKGDR